jgi:apolipoprotein N-acyltransferase
MNEHQVGFVTGIVNYNFETDEAYNTLLSMGFSGEGQIPRPYQYGHSNRYDKHHLLPIGEFVPLENWLRGISPLFDLPMSSFDRGPRVQSNIMANNILLAPAICFEIAFPSQIRQNLTEETHFILTVSNDAWFGNSHGPHQHMQIAQARAKEFGIPVIRSTNNGVTALVNHKGELHSQIPQFEAQVLRSEIQPVTGKTLYAVIGNGLIWIISLISYIFGYVLSKREKHLFH